VAELLALLIGNTAGGLACRLARSLAFAAAVGLGALFEVAGYYGLNSFHGFLLPYVWNYLGNYIILLVS